MIRDHRGHTWSEATQNPCKFFTSLGQSKNPEIQYFQKYSQKFQGFIKKIFVRELWFTWISGLLDYY